MEKEILKRIHELENRYKTSKRMNVVFAVIVMVSLLNFGFVKSDKFNIIRAKGIVIEDANGKDRILIGAPAPFSKNRVRTDTNLVRKYWASQFKDPNQYMGWYKKYKNDANGIIFMNEDGFDRVLVGENLADPNVGVRPYEVSGILVNNKKGWERVGGGVNTGKDGKSRQGFGVDDDSGEAMHLVTFEDGSKALILSDENGSIRIGMSEKPGELLQNKESFTGIKYFNNQGKLVWEQKMDSTKKR